MTGLKPGVRQRLENLGRRKVPPYQVISPELSRDLAHLSFESGRQIGLLIGRDGGVETVLVGGPRSLYIPDLPKSRGGRWRLRGLRLVHTHLGSEPLSQDDLMDLVFLRLDCVGAVRVDQQRRGHSAGSRSHTPRGRKRPERLGGPAPDAVS